MVRTEKMELLKALVGECLSAAAEEIIRIVQKTLTDYEEDMSCSKWAVDGDHRPMTGVVLSGSMERVCEEETESNHTEPDSRPANSQDHIDEVDTEDDSVKHGPNLLQVGKATTGFSAKTTMVQHVENHSGDRSLSYQCQLCDRCFCHESEFILHTRIHNGAKPHKSQDWEGSFNQRRDLDVHTRKHTWQHRGQCVMKPEEESRRGEDVSDGLQSGVGVFPFSVPPYEQREFEQGSPQPPCLYQIRTAADIHIDSQTVLTAEQIKTEPATADDGEPEPTTNSHHPVTEEVKVERCIQNLLPKTIPGKATELVVQVDSGTAQKPYKCPCCSKCFSLTKTLIRHMKIHSEDKVYQCRICGWKFCQKSALVNHTRVHTGERPYRCQECHKTFTQKGNLMAHMKKHGQDESHQCGECGCCFSHKAALDGHMQSHRFGEGRSKGDG